MNSKPAGDITAVVYLSYTIYEYTLKAAGTETI